MAVQRSSTSDRQRRTCSMRVRATRATGSQPGASRVITSPFGCLHAPPLLCSFLTHALCDRSVCCLTLRAVQEKNTTSNLKTRSHILHQRRSAPHASRRFQRALVARAHPSLFDNRFLWRVFVCSHTTDSENCDSYSGRQKFFPLPSPTPACASRHCRRSRR